MIGKRLLCPRCKQVTDSLNRLALKCWNCGHRFEPSEFHRVRPALLKPTTPSAGTDWDFAFGAKVNNINLGKCRPLDQDEQQRRKRIEDWTIGMSQWDVRTQRSDVCVLHCCS